MQYDFDRDLLAYFTDVEYLREAFKGYVAAPSLPKNLLVIHGMGGVGKSSLLRMFRLHCKSTNVPVALVSGDEAKSVLDVLYLKTPTGDERGWVPDLKTAGIAMPTFMRTYEHYRSILAKAENEASEFAKEATKGVAKTLIDAAASTIPGIGPLLGKLTGVGVDALTNLLLSRGFKKADIDLLLDPAKILTDSFLTDLAKAAEKRRVVLMLDTFERMTALDDWTREVAHLLPANVLFVIAGRALPEWDRPWPEWAAHAYIEDLKPMTEEVMRDLARRYYATMRGGEPDPGQIEAIIRFARGLPVVVTSIVQLWVKYPDRVGDLKAINQEVMADLVDRLMEGVPNPLIPMLEAAAALRWFDQPILRQVTGLADVREMYNELRNFPFARMRTEGYALHDAVREIIDENLRVQDCERHSELHTRAAAYFEKRLEKATGEEAERLSLEHLYHCIRADEESGIRLFQKKADELVRYRFVNRLRALLNDVNTYPLQSDDSRAWRDYYLAYLLDLEGRWLAAEDLFTKTANNLNASTRVRSYALVRCGTYLARPERISKTGGVDRAMRTFQSVVDMAVGYDSNTILADWELGILNQRLGQWDKAWQHFEKINQYASALEKSYETIYLKNLLKDPYAKNGKWRELLKLHHELITLLDELSISSELKANILPNWALGLVWTGHYAEAEQILRDGIKVSDKFSMDASGYQRDLGFSLASQDRFEEAQIEFQKGMDESKEWGARRENFDLDRAILLHFSFWGWADLYAGELQDARRKFLCATALKRKHKDYIGFPELYVGLGTIYELLSDPTTAQRWYSRCVKLEWTGRNNYICAAYTGFARVKHTQGDYAAIPPLLKKAEQLAQEYEYNDYLASLRLMQGHLAWEGKGDVLSPTPGEMASPLLWYQQALIHALRYNRFLFDEVLIGRPRGTPLRPIIPHCLNGGKEGKQMLIALRDWWKTGTNDIGSPRPDTVSPIPEGIPLLEAERIARKLEPGDGAAQISIIEQIDRALKENIL